MAITIAEISSAVKGDLAGDGTAVIHGLAGLREAGSGDITFLSNARYQSAVQDTKASAVIVGKDWDGACPCALIRVENADAAFTAVASLFAPTMPAPAAGVHATAVVAEDVELDDSVSIGPHCVLESAVCVGARTVLVAGCYLGHGTTVGEDCRFYPHVTTREFTVIGDRVIIHNGAVIGSDGFGYVQESGAWKKIAQIGTVEIGADVEIGANVTIDRARFGKTVIGQGVKIDNLVQIAHNVRLGDHTAIAAQVGIAGSTTIGRGVQIGGQAGASGHVTIGDHAIVAGRAGVTKDIPAKTFVSDFPAIPHRKARRVHAHVMRLPDLKKRVDEMEKRVESLEKKTP